MTIRKGVNMKKEKDVKVVERLEDICVMGGIDFKANQKIVRANDRVRKEYIEKKRKERYNKRLYIAGAIAITIVIIIASVLIFKDTDKNIDDCVSKGYTRAYCEKLIIGL